MISSVSSHLEPEAARFSIAEGPLALILIKLINSLYEVLKRGDNK